MLTSSTQIKISDYTLDYISSQEGFSVGERLDKIIQDHPEQVIEISLDGISFVGPSFINGAFIYLLDLYGENYFRKYIKLINTNSRVGGMISQQLKRYAQKLQGFEEKFDSTNIFCAIDNSASGKSIRNKLAHAENESLNTSNFLYNSSSNIFSIESHNKIKQATSFIGILTTNTHIYQESLLGEVYYALEQKKPVLLVLKKGIRIDVILPEPLESQLHTVYYDDDSEIKVIRDINKIVVDNRSQNDIKKNSKKESITSNDAMAWTALGIVAILLVLWFLNKDDDE